MTWAIKTRGDSKALIAAEYECPVHGRFVITVPRDHVADEMPCPEAETLVATYRCPVHGEFAEGYRCDFVPSESLCGHPVDDDICVEVGSLVSSARRGDCGFSSPWRFPSPYGRVQRVTAARRGKDPEPPPGAFDWRSLAEGQDHDEWERKERKKDLDYVYRSVKRQVIG